MVVQLVILQNKRHGPIPQIFHIRIHILLCQLIRRIEKIIRLPYTTAKKTKIRKPGTIQSNPCFSCKALITPFKQKIRIRICFRNRIGIAQKKSHIFLCCSQFPIVTQNQKYTAGIITSEIIQHFFKDTLCIGTLHFFITQKSSYIRLVFCQKCFEFRIQKGTFIAHLAPLIRHGIFQYDPAIFY